MRRHVVTADPSAVRAQDHTSWCGHGPHELHRVAARTFSSARVRNERLLLVADAPRTDWLDGLADADVLVERGILQLTTVDEAYANAEDPAAQRAQFDQLVEQAIADGYSGLCVVGDNSRLIGGTDEDFDAWLSWEATADQMQATRPLTGLCYFDLDQVPSSRLTELAAMHLVRSEGFPEPPFQIFFDDGALRLRGELDSFVADALGRVVGAALDAAHYELDISGVTFINHRALIALEHVARTGSPVRLRGARPVVRRIWEMVDLPGTLEFCA